MFCLQKVAQGIWFLAFLKLCPVPLAKFLVYTGLAKRLSSFFRMAPCSLTEVVNKLTENKDLRAVFGYIFGTYGTPSRSSAGVMNLFLQDSAHSFPSPICRKHAKRCQFFYAQLAGQSLPEWCLVPERWSQWNCLPHDPHHWEGWWCCSGSSPSQSHLVQWRQGSLRWVWFRQICHTQSCPAAPTERRFTAFVSLFVF